MLDIEEGEKERGGGGFKYPQVPVCVVRNEAIKFHCGWSGSTSVIIL